jgi:hypothetical protein
LSNASLLSTLTLATSGGKIMLAIISAIAFAYSATLASLLTHPRKEIRHG